MSVLFLQTYCSARGFSGSTHAGPDHPRGSRYILKDYTEGSLLYAHPPPGGWGAQKALHCAAAKEPQTSALINVLLPAVQQRYQQNLASVVQVSPGRVDAGKEKAVVTCSIGSASRYHRDQLPFDAALDTPSYNLGGNYTLASAFAPECDAVAVQSEDEDTNNESESDELDASLLASFVRRVVLPPPVSQSSALEALTPFIQAVATNSSERGIVREARAPRVPGNGKYGRLKKGKRPADPYGCEAAADAANRSWHRSEVAVVAQGFEAAAGLNQASDSIFTTV